jgi:lipoprotein-anchoring transpeptidase ErfK/SrfK
MKRRNTRGDSQAKQRVALAVFAHLAPKAAHHALMRHVLWSSAFILLTIVPIWVAGNVYGMKYDLEGTMLSARSSDVQLEKAIEQTAQNYRLQILRPDGARQEFSLQDMGMRVHTKSSIEIVRQRQRSLNNRMQWWRSISFKLAISADDRALEVFIAKHATITVEPARDASLSIVEGSVQLTDAVNGKQYGLTDPRQTVLDAASRMQTSPLRLKVIAQQPTVTKLTLAETKIKLEKALQQPIIFAINGQEIRAGPKDIAGWITLTTNPEQKTVTPVVNAEAIQAYINQLANSHYRAPRAQVNLGSGGVIQGVTGVTVTNTTTAAAHVTEHILDGKGLHIDLPVRRTPFRTVNVASAGKWLEVDLTNKRMYAYNGDTLVRTFLISAGAPGTPTVTGTFAIYSKFSQQTMSGPNADGSRYVQPNVPWVNYFYRDYAIHGNYWRPTSYFGNVNSSHGCVGLLTGDSSWVYSWAPIGTPVVVHT